MLSLPAVIAVSVGCTALIIVGAVVGVAVWWRTRQDRLSLAVAQTHHRAAYQEQACNSLTTKSPIISPLSTYPYGVHHEWAPLGSQETFQRPLSQANQANQAKPCPPILKKEKSKSLRRSISKSLSKSLSLGRSSQKPIHLEPLPTTSSEPFKTLPDAKEKEPKSAIAGFSELPAEITPRSTPERERDDIMQLNMLNPNPRSTAWPLLQPEQRLSSVTGGQPAYIDENHARVRNGSITAQTAGTAPSMPMPPPPMSAAQSYQYPREDSLMNMSSLSLETANSSILDGSRRRSMSADQEFNYSPSLPPCPTFTPFSPYDIVIGGSVARDCASRRRIQARRLSSSTAHLTSVSMEFGRELEGGQSPRRSLTTREVLPQPPEWSCRLPRRSETVLSSSSLGRSSNRGGSRPVSTLSGSSPNPLYSSGQGLYSRQDFGSQSHRQERYSMYEKSHGKEDQNIVFSKSLGDRPKSTQTPSPGGTRDGLVKTSLPSAMKSTHSLKKGHKRQNCVRISIHPPITFAGPAFSPMLEEPEEVLDFDNDLVNPIRRLQPHSSNRSPPRGPGSRDHRNSGPNRHSSTDSIQEEPPILGPFSGTGSRMPRPNTSKKRPHSRTNSTDDVFTSENKIVIPDPIIGQSSDHGQLLTTPSPERHEPLWSLPHSDDFTGFSPKLPANASTGSPRRSAPKGPRNQPDRIAKKAVPPPFKIEPSFNDEPTLLTQRPSSRDSSKLNTLGESLGLAPYPKDIRKSVTLLRRMNSEACDEDSKQYRSMDRNISSTWGDDNDIETPPSNRNSLLSNDTLTIWEDDAEDNIITSPLIRQKIYPFRTLERIDSEGTAEDSFDCTMDNHPQLTIRQVPPSSSIITIEDCNHDLHFESADGSVSKRGRNATALQTPKRSTRNNVSVAPTPGSLYDGDGFLKE